MIAVLSPYEETMVAKWAGMVCGRRGGYIGQGGVSKCMLSCKSSWRWRGEMEVLPLTAQRHDFA
jgi:hypothetical protein